MLCEWSERYSVAGVGVGGLEHTFIAMMSISYTERSTSTKDMHFYVP